MIKYTFLEKIKNKKITCGLMVFEFFTPGLSKIVKECGADFIIYDTEHSGIGIETIKNMVSIPIPLCSVSYIIKSAPHSFTILDNPGVKNSKTINPHVIFLFFIFSKNVYLIILKLIYNK
jgi:hypothetical protein